MCVCVPVGLVVSVDSGETLAPSDGSGGEASDRTYRQRHGGESSGWTPYADKRRRTINTQHSAPLAAGFNILSVPDVFFKIRFKEHLPDVWTDVWTYRGRL